MKVENCTLSDITVSYPLEQIAPLEQILFLDIETTGFTARTSSLYMIGCVFYENGHWNTRQWFAQHPSEEKEILTAFFAFADNFTHLIHFNGNNFDLPFLLQKAEQCGLSYSFDKFVGIDIYRRVAPYKNFLKLPNCKQKTIEYYLGIHRKDIYTGGELISVYQSYVEQPNDVSLKELLLHNFEDLKGMLAILPILSYYDLFNLDIIARKVQANYYDDIHGFRRQELLMKLIFPSSLPVAVSAMGKGCHFKGEGTEGALIVPIYEEEMKYFYANYKDYYYLPSEDMALHKYISSFVDKEYRQQATASNCYTRKLSLYLPQWEILFTPFFKREYRSEELFFELTDEIKRERLLFSKYASHVLNIIAFQA